MQRTSKRVNWFSLIPWLNDETIIIWIQSILQYLLPSQLFIAFINYTGLQGFAHWQLWLIFNGNGTLILNMPTGLEKCWFCRVNIVLMFIGFREMCSDKIFHWTVHYSSNSSAFGRFTSISYKGSKSNGKWGR